MVTYTENAIFYIGNQLELKSDITLICRIHTESFLVMMTDLQEIFKLTMYIPMLLLSIEEIWKIH